MDETTMHWSMLVRRLNAKNHVDQNKEQVRDVLVEEWNNLLQKMINAVIRVKRRMIAIIRSGGNT